jgi:hypothetical protein
VPGGITGPPCHWGTQVQEPGLQLGHKVDEDVALCKKYFCEIQKSENLNENWQNLLTIAMIQKGCFVDDDDGDVDDDYDDYDGADDGEVDDDYEDEVDDDDDDSDFADDYDYDDDDDGDDDDDEVDDDYEDEVDDDGDGTDEDDDDDGEEGGRRTDMKFLKDRVAFDMRAVGQLDATLWDLYRGNGSVYCRFC